MSAVKPLEWMQCPALGAGWKLVAMDCFGNEFARLDLPKPQSTIDAFKAVAQDDYERRILSALVTPLPEGGQ